MKMTISVEDLYDEPKKAEFKGLMYYLKYSIVALLFLMLHRFWNKKFLKFFIIGVVATLLNAFLTTLTGVLLYESPFKLFFVNAVCVTGSIFILKYVVYQKYGVIEK